MPLQVVLGQLPRVAAHLPAFALGVVGFVSGIVEPSATSVALGLLLAGLALGAAYFPSPLRGISAAGLVASLLALATFHAHGLLMTEEPACGCLRAVGNPHRAIVLMALSVGLLSSGLPLGKEVAEPPMRGRAGHLVVLLALSVAVGLLVSLSLNSTPRVVPSQNPLLRPAERLDESRPVLTGSGSLRPKSPPEKHGDPSAGWSVDLIPPPSARADAIAVILRSPGGAWESAEQVPVKKNELGQLEVTLPLEKWPTRPIDLGVEAEGQPVQVIQIDWEADPSTRGSVRWGEGPGITGLVVDGVGAPVAGIELVFAEEFRFPGLWNAGRRVAAAAEGRMLAVARSDAQGRFRVHRWPSDRVYAASIDPAWRVLREATDPGAVITGDATQREIRVAVGRVALALLRVAGPPPKRAPWAEPIRIFTTDRRWPGAVEQSRGILFGDLEIPLDPGVHICLRAVVLDGSVDFEGQPAATVVVRAPGCVDQAISAVWSTPHKPSVALCDLQPRVEGPPERLTVGLTAKIEGFTDAAMARADVSDLSGEESYVMSFSLAGGGTRIESTVALPRGRYRIRSPLLTEDVMIDNGGQQTLAKPAPLHVIDVDSSDGARALGSVTFTTSRYSPEPVRTVTGDGYFGLNFALSERAANRARYAFPLIQDDVRVFASGPGWTSATGTVSLRSEGVTALHVGEGESLVVLPSGR